MAHENLKVVDLADVFRGLNPHLRVTDLVTGDADQRNYRVSVRRLRKEGFKAKLSVATGAEAIIEAIVSGIIRDPESVFYRNAKWLKELTHIGEKNHREVMGLMETMALAGQPSRIQGAAWT